MSGQPNPVIFSIEYPILMSDKVVGHSKGLRDVDIHRRTPIARSDQPHCLSLTNKEGGRISFSPEGLHDSTRFTQYEYWKKSPLSSLGLE